MLDIYRKILRLLTPQERVRLYLLMLMMTVMGLLEVLGVASIAPFMAVLGNPDIIQQHPVLSRLYNDLGFASPNRFLFSLGLSVLFFVIAANAFSALTLYAMMRYVYQRGHRLSVNLLESYLNRPYHFFLQQNTAELAKNILLEVARAIPSVLVPAIQLIARGTVVVFILIFLLWVNWRIAVTMIVVLGCLYGGLIYALRQRLGNIGRASTAASGERFRVIQEALQGIKELKLLGAEPTFIDRFSRPSDLTARHEATYQVLAVLPKYLFETVAFGGILLILLYQMRFEGDVSRALPLISLYAFAGYRLMPSLQQMFNNLSVIRFNQEALFIVHRDLVEETAGICLPTTTRVPPLPLQQAITFSEICYRYPESARDVLRSLDLTIPANTTVAFVGSTGAGKTTAVDLLLGLLIPTAGTIRIDGTNLTPANLARWQNQVGYVPQQIFLSDDSVVANIALGELPENINREAIIRAAKIARLHDFVMSELPQGFDTLIGERGVRLSGGQRQRIGLARALYRDPAVLILDEATSALDNVTESHIIEALHELAHRKTIIMIAHRLSTVRECDTIFLLEQGQVTGLGTYDQLMRDNARFRELAKAATLPQ